MWNVVICHLFRIITNPSEISWVPNMMVWKRYFHSKYGYFGYVWFHGGGNPFQTTKANHPINEGWGSKGSLEVVSSKLLEVTSHETTRKLIGSWMEPDITRKHEEEHDFCKTLFFFRFQPLHSGKLNSEIAGKSASPIFRNTSSKGTFSPC